MMRKTGVEVEIAQIPEALLDGERTYSGADMEALLTRAKFRAATHALDDKPAPALADDGGQSEDEHPEAEPSEADRPEGEAAGANGAHVEEGAPSRTVSVVAEPTPDVGVADGERPSDGRGIDRAVLQTVVDDFVPPSYPLQVELQNLVAVMECTSRSMLPERFRNLDREATVRRVEELKRLIGER